MANEVYVQGRALRGTHRVLPAHASWVVVAVIIALVGRYFWQSEGQLENILFTAATSLALVCLIALICRRIMFAFVLVGAFIAIIAVIASAKRQIMNMVVHAYDLFFYLSSWSTISFLWNDHRSYVVAFVAAASALVLVGWVTYRIDPTRVARSHAAVALTLFIGLATVGVMTKGERRHMQFNFENLYISSFYASWGETLETLWRGQLLEAAPQAGGPRLGLPADGDCRTSQKPPHILLIHQESVVPPQIFPSLKYDRSVDPFFTSHDGLMHRMRVETYGGASWLTEFSILAGVSTHAFGGMRQFVQTFMQGKLKDTLPQALGRCGYRNVVFYPMLKNFVSNAAFYKSIGLNEIYDLKDQGAKRVNERDRFYYTNALNFMQKEVKATNRPFFLFIQTMSAHWPYNVVYEPDVKVPGGGPGTHPEMSEYLRRVAMGQMDYAFLKEELQRRFPGEKFLIVHYGDHQPMSTRTLLGFKDETDAEDVDLSPQSIGFTTYYAVDGVNYKPPPLPVADTLEVPYLGSLILEWARLPMSESHRERLRLMLACQGRYHTCADRDRVMSFHRRLIDGGIVEAR